MRLIVAANRGPVRKTDDGWAPAIGGLASALLPVIKEQKGVWVSIQEESDLPLHQEYHDEESSITLRRVPLSEDELQQYYLGMSNSVLWPVSHYMIHHLEFSHEYFEVYRAINQRFAEVVGEEYRDGDVIWVQDYHLMLTPKFIRERFPDSRIGFFWHIPWPAMEVYRILPWARDLMHGVLACNLIGFHVDEYVENFLEGANVLLGARTWKNRLLWQGREVRVEAHPIGIDVALFEQASEKMQKEAEEIRAEVGTEFLVVGVDRLDYTKGLLSRLLAFEKLLEEHTDLHGRVTLYQVATPSRTEVESYKQLKREVDETVGRINGAYAQENWVPVRYRYRSYTPDELAALYRAADVMLITPLRDGMNLVAHEFISASQSGALILSEMTGASYLLTEAIQVNPYDYDAVKRVIIEALEMPVEEKRKRLSRLKRKVKQLDVHKWADRFLGSLGYESHL